MHRKKMNLLLFGPSRMVSETLHQKEHILSFPLSIFVCVWGGGGMCTEFKKKNHSEIDKTLTCHLCVFQTSGIVFKIF